MNPGFKASWTRIRWVILILGAVLILNALLTPAGSRLAFFHVAVKDGHLYGSLIDIVDRAGPVMLLSLGMSLVIATGGVDLSVGAVMAIAGSLAARLISESQFGFGIAAALSVSFGAALGLWNGLLVSFVGVQPIVATLILMVAGRGVAQLLTHGQILTFENPAFVFIGSGFFAGLPFTFTLVTAALIATTLLVRKTALGLFIESVGDNEMASRFAGINTRFIKCLCYGASGCFAAVAGLIVASDIKAADANNAGLYLELDAILAVVLGGTALTGGRFYLFNSLIGALLIQTLTTIILTRGVPVEFTLVIKAVIILLVCLAQSEQFRAALVRIFAKPHEAAA